MHAPVKNTWIYSILSLALKLGRLNLHLSDGHYSYKKALQPLSQLRKRFCHAFGRISFVEGCLGITLFLHEDLISSTNPILEKLLSRELIIAYNAIISQLFQIQQL